MKSIQSFNSVRILLLAVLAAGLSASLASAQEFEGKFTLPFEARWGQAVLPPGDYTFTVNDASSGKNIIVRGDSLTVIVFSNGGISDYKDTEHSELIAVRSGGGYRIVALQLAPLGLSLQYMMPKTEREVLAQAPQLIQRVSVRMGG
jgi:hypothetical protein